MTDIELIAHHGGSAKFARLLGLTGAKGVRRVCNWKKRGIPAAVKVAFPAVFRLQFWPELASQPQSGQEAAHG